VSATPQSGRATAGTRERILHTTAELFRRYGYTGTGLKQIVSDANAPFGSLYHFFPGGKRELGEEVIRQSGQMYQELVEAVFDAAPDAISGTSECFLGAAATLEETDYADACPIETVALEVASTDDALRQATADVFESWVQSAVERFAAAGIPKRKARELAVSMIALLEGAFVLSRAMRSTEPLQIAGASATAAVRSALRAKRAGRRRPGG
jgi:AcrR family transcriptional regulator